jgi:hypothetical protein
MSRALNRLVAEKVMGWRHTDAGSVVIDGTPFCPSEFQPSTEIKDAWEVVEKMDVFWFEMSYQHAADDGMEHERSKVDIYRSGGFDRVTSAIAATLPLAVCKAALGACGVDEATIEGAMK